MRNKPRFILNLAFIIVISILLYRFIYYNNIFVTYPYKDRQFFNTLTLIFICIGLSFNIMTLFLKYPILRIFSLITGILAGLFTLIYGMLFCYFDIIYFDAYASIWLILHVILGNLAMGLEIFSFIY
ncbi:MAG: hypothetical protein ACTSYZ_02915 [Candidatus Helarchaeota archaeon]